MNYYNLYKLSNGKDYVCCVPIEGYERAVYIGKHLSTSTMSIYIKSILVEDYRAHEYYIPKGLKYYNY